MRVLKGKINNQLNAVKKKQTAKIDITVIFLILFFIMISRGQNSEIYISFGIMFVWLYTAFLMDIDSFIKSVTDKNMIWLYIYFIYIFITSMILEGLMISLGLITGQMTLFIGILMFNYYKNKYSTNRFRKILSVIMIILTYYSIKALIFYIANPYAARTIVSGNGAHYGDITIGDGYSLAFGLAILCVYLFNLLATNYFKSKLKELILIITIILFFIVIIKAGSTITLIATIIGFIYSIIFFLSKRRLISNKDMPVQKVWFLITLCSVGLLLLFSAKKIGSYLINYSYTMTDKLLSSRVEQIGVKLQTGSSEGTLGVRERLYNQSFKTFIENPIFGTSSEFGLRMNSLLGGHSEFFDSLGKLGIVGTIPLILIFSTIIIAERKQNKELIPGSYILTLIILFVFNPFHYAQANFILLFIIPSLGWLLYSNRSNGK